MNEDTKIKLVFVYEVAVMLVAAIFIAWIIHVDSF